VLTELKTSYKSVSSSCVHKYVASLLFLVCILAGEAVWAVAGNALLGSEEPDEVQQRQM